MQLATSALSPNPCLGRCCVYYAHGQYLLQLDGYGVQTQAGWGWGTKWTFNGVSQWGWFQTLAKVGQHMRTMVSTCCNTISPTSPTSSPSPSPPFSPTPAPTRPDNCIAWYTGGIVSNQERVTEAYYSGGHNSNLGWSGHPSSGLGKCRLGALP